MEISNNGIVVLNRGDTFKTPLYIYSDNTAEFIEDLCKTKISNLESTQTVYFGVIEPGYKFEDAIIRKEYNSTDYDTTNQQLMINLKPEDTEYLLPGRYYYEIKMETIENNGATRTVTTITPKTIFFIVE